MIPIDVVGVGLSQKDITTGQEMIIQYADLLVGGRRHLDLFSKGSQETLVIDRDIPLLVESIKDKMKNRRVVVLASGDPLFYGIGTTLIQRLGKENVVIHPNISSVSMAFAAIKEPWHDAAVISLHGRTIDDIDPILEKKDKIAILTDGRHSPSWVAGRLLKAGNKTFSMCVLEHLGSTRQTISWHDDWLIVSSMNFAMPNVVILKRKTEKIHPQEREGLHQPWVSKKVFISNTKESTFDNKTVYSGMPDEFFSHENGLITKSEIRSIVISKLRLVSDSHLFWDLGAGSGSVSIEVSRFIPKGSIFSVEKNEKRILQIEENCLSFNVSNIKAVHGELPGKLSTLPDPDRIFIGGGGKKLNDIISSAMERLAIGGVIVVNTILLQTMESARKLFKAGGFGVDLIQVQVSRSKAMPFGERLEALNPVWIITAKKRSNG